MSEETKYPEHEKLALVCEKSKACGAFMQWLLHEKKITVCNEYVEEEDMETEEVTMCLGYYDPFFKSTMNFRIYPASPNLGRMEDVLAEYFDIDLKKIEEEKQAMLEEIREVNAQSVPSPL